ncbi:unnamed protein product, partial [Prorocentrum cordatum]
GLSYDENRRRAKKLKINCETVRNALLAPPANVRRLLDKLPGSGVHAKEWDVELFVLELLKPLRGLAGAPHLWQVAATLYMVDVLRARVSLWVENFAHWTHADLPGKIRSQAQEARSVDDVAAALSIHADDLLSTGRSRHLEHFLGLPEAKFGAVKGQQHPFTHNGARHSRLKDGTILLQQIHQLSKIPFCQVPEGVDDKMVTGVYAHGFRSILTSMLFLCQRNIHIMTEVTQLQGFNNEPRIVHLKR